MNTKCVCAEINSRNCPVHQNQSRSEATELADKSDMPERTHTKEELHNVSPFVCTCKNCIHITQELMTERLSEEPKVTTDAESLGKQAQQEITESIINDIPDKWLKELGVIILDDGKRVIEGTEVDITELKDQLKSKYLNGEKRH